ncbi:MAG: hypothetical protein GX800_01345 [Clostridiaceae bacterium]|jgi:hypothetical protein|nr:hypothetical protein [Clostridiaceae bacterium]
MENRKIKRTLLFSVVIIGLALLSLYTYAASEKVGKEISYEIPQVVKDKNLGAELPFIVYESEHQLVFYNYMGIFIYDLDSAAMVKAFIPANLQFYHDQATAVDFDKEEKAIRIYNFSTQNDYFYVYHINDDKFYQYPIDQWQEIQDKPKVTGRMDTSDWSAWNLFYISELTGEKYYPFRSIVK